MDSEFKLEPFTERYYTEKETRPGDTRDAYEHDKGRIIHSSSFRRLQNKTQVSAPQESDFHRTRLTHSLETAQIAEGIITALHHRLANSPAETLSLPSSESAVYLKWLPSSHLICAACYAHDLGHPPLGHSGEKALHDAMHDTMSQQVTNKHAQKYGGFEANAHTIRLLTKLEPYSQKGGINPSRRTILSTLKYPLSFSRYRSTQRAPDATAKYYFDSEHRVIAWAAGVFPPKERQAYLTQNPFINPKSADSFNWIRTLDADIMDIADKIAYCTHDVEDAIARGFIDRDNFQARIAQFTDHSHGEVLFELPCTPPAKITKAWFEDIINNLFSKNEYERKQGISRLIHAFIIAITPTINDNFTHPLLRYTICIPQKIDTLLTLMKNIVIDLVINRPVQKILERRGKKMIKTIFDSLYEMRQPHAHDHHAPAFLNSLGIQQNVTEGGIARGICDYIAGMTDYSVARMYHLLCTPGYGNSNDEL